MSHLRDSDDIGATWLTQRPPWCATVDSTQGREHPMTTTPTKAQTARAKAYLSRAGYFQESATLVHCCCPDCRFWVDAQVVAWAKPRERVAALAGLLAEHLTHCARFITEA